MNRIRKYIALLLCIITLNNCIIVKAYDLSSETDGLSTAVDLPSCIGDGENCATFSENFIIRATLVDQNRKIVSGTKTVEFKPLNPYNKTTILNYLPGGSGTYQAYGNNVYENPENAYLNSDIENDYVFVGSSITGNRRENMSQTGYYVFLGFEEGTQAVEETFDNYNEHRRIFIDYATNMKIRQIRVNNKEYTGQVNFADFFLRVSGYTSVWNLSTSMTDEAQTKRQQLTDNSYYIIIEPVYSYAVKHGGVWHGGTGTTKQLATMSAIAYNFDNYQDWFWVPYYSELAYNYSCNFLELSNDLNFDKSNTYKCGNFDNFKFYEERAIPVSQQTDGSTVSALLKALRESTLKTVEKMIAFSGLRAKRMLTDLSDPNSAFGVNVINISESFKKNIPVIQKNECTITTQVCTNNSFNFSIRLSSKDPASCVFPKINGLKSDQLKDYVYSTDGDDNSKLWCYDDISYNFGSLKNRFTNNINVSPNQLLEIPSGKLTVTRTCFSKTDMPEKNGSLNNVMQTEPDNLNNLYQKSFKLKLNGNYYSYNLNQQKYQTENGEKKYNNFSHDKVSESGYIKYKSTFYYDYNLSTGETDGNVSLNINSLEMQNSFGNTNAIDIEKKYGESSSIIKVQQNIQSGTTFLNELYTDKNGSQTYFNMSNAFGLSNKLYNKLNSKTKETTTDDSTKKEKTSTTIANNTGSIIVTNNYSLTNNILINSCSFNTTTDLIPPKGQTTNAIFRVISLSNPFPARDGTSRIPGENWINKSENNVYEYIENNRNVNREEIYQQEPLYTITLDTQAMVRIREYNKSHNYSQYDITCETGTGRMCISNFLRNTKYINNLEGTCSSITPKEITKSNKTIQKYLNNCGRNCTNADYDTNKDGRVTSDDLLNADFYTCADKTSKSGG